MLTPKLAMGMKPSSHKRGLHDSSLTRVQPVFQQLIQQDQSGLSWLPTLMDLVSVNSYQATRIRNNSASLLPELAEKRRIGGNILNYYGVETIELENCFEKSIPPSKRFLRWCIEHPEQLTWPRGGKERYSQRTQNKRENLIGLHGLQAKATAKKEALEALDKLGAERAHTKWWAFEGNTSVDCYLETENILLLIEGKRTEKLSESISWYPGRNQLIRILDVAKEISGGKEFGVMVIAETQIEPISEEVIEKSLPHLSKDEIEELMSHYLGCLLWQEVCNAVDITYDNLPNTVTEWVEKL